MKSYSPHKLAAVMAGVLSFFSTPDLTASEFRGLWVDAWGAGFQNPEEIKQLVDHCRTYNFNAVVVQMRRRGDAFYMPHAPNGEPRTTVLRKDFDALQELIDACHKGEKRIEVHCWVTSFLVWSGKTAPSQPEHVFNAHPEFFMTDSSGNRYIGEGSYLDPGNPDAGRWNYNMAKDIVSNYDIDGFHWDYIRYPAMDSGYNPTAIARYNSEFGLTGKPSPGDPQFSTWRRRQVTDFLRWCNADLLEIKPKLAISCAVFGSRTDAYNARFQDWAAWNSEGIIDICMPMGYTPDMTLFSSRVDDIAAHRGIRHVYQGQGSYLCEPTRTIEQLEYVRNAKQPGYLLYSYRCPEKGRANKDEVFSMVREKLQPAWSETPSIPWKENPANGLLKGVVTRVDTGASVYNVSVSIEGVLTRSQKTEPHGGFAFFETVPGTYLVKAFTPNLGVATTTVRIAAGQIQNVNLVLPAIDKTAPAIAHLAAESVMDTSAVITWATDEETTGSVIYSSGGKKSNAGQDSKLSRRHSVKLTGLAPRTAYQFFVKSKDEADNKTVSNKLTFTTLREGAVPEIIIDNSAAKIIGAWSSGSSAWNKHGADYRYKTKGDGEACVEYRPNILKTGEYDVFEWHCEGANRATTTPIVISYHGGTATQTVNQRINGGEWLLLGRFRFAEGAEGFVKVTDAFTDEGKNIALADAVKFVYAGPGKSSEANSGQ